MPGLMDDAIERQELFCHACSKYVQFDLDLGLDGNHVLNCPNCGHEHCRVVKNGKITDVRWDQRNEPTIGVTAIYGWTQTTQNTGTSAYLYGYTAAGSCVVIQPFTISPVDYTH